MTDLAITTSQVLPSTGADTARGTAGATITRGQPVYRDAADANSLKPCIATSQAAAECVGIALEDAFDGQPVLYQYGGIITLGAAAAPVDGELYVVSGITAGGISAFDDLPASSYLTIIGIANSNNAVILAIKPSRRVHVPKLFSAIALNGSTAVTNQTETIAGSVLIPALATPAFISVRATGDLDGNDVASLILRLYLGGTETGVNGTVVATGILLAPPNVSPGTASWGWEIPLSVTSTTTSRTNWLAHYKTSTDATMVYGFDSGSSLSFAAAQYLKLSIQWFGAGTYTADLETMNVAIIDRCSTIATP